MQKVDTMMHLSSRVMNLSSYGGEENSATLCLLLNEAVPYYCSATEKLADFNSLSSCMLGTEHPSTTSWEHSGK